MAKMAKMTIIIVFCKNPLKFLLAIKSLGRVASVETKIGARAKGAMGSHMSGTKMHRIGQPYGHPQQSSQVKEKEIEENEKAPSFLLETNAVTF